ncbi:MAG: acyl-ACP desaturase [Deltaproteobacteria bacterium]|nr:acyl-ACP desaturase [Deltaproteobacteria bacterium]
MSSSPTVHEKAYRTYLEFFEVAERKRRWNVFDDIPWADLDASTNTEQRARCIETFSAQFAAFESEVFSSTWQLPFPTRRQMYCYGALQEVATYLAYKAQKDLAIREGDPVRQAIFSFLSRDEAAHAGFYRAMVSLDLSEDRAGTLADLAYVISRFKMPGDGLIPDYQQRLRSSGAGISTRLFVEHGLLPTLRTLGTSRAELKAVLQK